MNIHEMKLASAGKLERMRAILNAAEGENRDLTAEETTEFNSLRDERAALSARIGREEELNREEANLSVIDEPGRRATPNEPAASDDPVNATEYVNAFAQMCRSRRGQVSQDVRAALQIGTSDGDWAVPEVFRKQMVAKLGNHNALRQICNVITTTSTENIPVVTDNGTAGWVDELGTYPESDMTGARLTLGAHKLGRICKMSEELLSDESVSIETTVSDAFAKSFGDAEEIGMISGDGNKKPNGLQAQVKKSVAAAAAAALTYDDVVDLQHGVKQAYRKNGVFLTNDNTVKILRKLKNDKGEPIWQDGMRAGEPDMLLGKPVYVSDAVADVGASKISMYFGDFKQGVDIGDRGSIFTQRLEELYAKEGAIGFRMRSRVDMIVKDNDAVAKLTHPAA